MIQGFYTAGSGLKAGQTGLDITANNIANINTTGYKRQGANFSELLRTNLKSVDDANVGTGVKATAASPDITSGSFESTGRELDFAVVSDGFFAVTAADGTVRYTRDGNFYISEGAGKYLITADGDYVLSRKGALISANDPNFRSQVGVYNFSNPGGLIHAGNNKFESSDTSGGAYITNEPAACGFLENSNVKMLDEMTNLIMLQKSYQLNAKMISTANEIEEIINSLR